MPDNRISATLSAADRQAVLDALQTIRQKLPFLVDLSPEDRRALPKMGEASNAFVSRALEVATQNPDILPRSFDVEEMRKDVELLDALSPVRSSFAQLGELLDDSCLAVGSEAYTAALAVYQYARGRKGRCARRRARRARAAIRAQGEQRGDGQAGRRQTLTGRDSTACRDRSAPAAV